MRTATWTSGLRGRLTKVTSVELFAVIVTCGVFGSDGQADLAVFVKAGGQVVRGVDPYVATSSPQLLDGHAFVYPWLSAWLFTPLSVLPSPLYGYVFCLLGGLAVMAGARWLGAPRGWAVVALLLCAPFARNAELGAVNAAFFFLLAALWHGRERTWVVAGSVTLLVGVKLFLAPILLWVLLTRSWRCTATTVGAVASFFVISFTLGPVGPTRYLAMLHRLSDYMGDRGMGLESAVTYFAPTSPARPIFMAVVGLALMVAVWMFIRGGRRNEAGLLGALVILSLMASPILWRPYLLLLFLALTLVRPRTRAMVLASALSWIVVGSERIPPVGGLDMGARLVSLYSLVAGLFYLCLRGRSAEVGEATSASIVPLPPSPLHPVPSSA